MSPSFGKGRCLKGFCLLVRHFVEIAWKLVNLGGVKAGIQRHRDQRGFTRAALIGPSSINSGYQGNVVGWI